MSSPKIASYSIVCNEASMIREIVEHHLPFLDAMYILDNGSFDGTLEYLMQTARSNPKLIVEKYEHSFTPDYGLDWHSMEQPFPEVEVRNAAIGRAELLTAADWLIQLDGDEVFLPRTRQIIEEQAGDVAFLGCSTINPIVPLSSHPIENRKGKQLYDPHARIFRTRYGVKMVSNPAFATQRNSQAHCIPTAGGSNRHLFTHPQIRFVDDPIHFHLHWLYGRKIELYFNARGTTDRRAMVDGHAKNEFADLLPAVFWERREEWLDNIIRPIFPDINLDLEKAAASK